LEAGALGLSSGLAYAPGPYAPLHELVDLGSMVGRCGGIYTSHIRNQTAGIAQAVEEVVAVGRQGDVRAHVSHMQPGAPRLGCAAELLERLVQVRQEGVDLSCDAIPYTVGSTTLKSLLPPWALEGGDGALLRRLKDPHERERMKADTLEFGAESGGSRKRNLVRQGQWDLIWLGTVERHPELAGKSFAEIGRARGQDPHDALLDVLVEEEARPWMLAQDVSEEDFASIAGHPLGGVISDGFSLAPDGPLAGGRHHPRSYGALPRFLRRAVREAGWLSWEEAIRKLSGFPASRFGLHGRGLLRPGFCADIVVLSPERLADRADFAAPERYPEGVAYVLVNGEVAVEDGRLLGRLAGRVLRRGEG
ncbi:MAG: amidohydrolase family protein, partial [Candidatus Latescibacterota bacterium]